MGHSAGLSVEEQRKADIKIGRNGFWVLLAVTIAEVFIALIGNGHLIEGFTLSKWIMGPIMIGGSLFKAYYIVSIFMHLGAEVGGFAATVVLPMALLIWAVIAFLWEGDYARQNRNYVKDARPGVESIEKDKSAESEKSTETSMKSIDDLPKQLSFR